MEETIYLIAGILIIIVVAFDFFYTTFSASGASFIAKFVSKRAHRLATWAGKTFSRRMHSLSGMLANLSVLAVWVLLAWIGLFLIFSFHPEGIKDNNGIPATAVERLYFTGYVLSTLGVGNFQPTTPSFEILTSFFSFFGFVFFTTSLTYLISVFSGIINKRSIALAVRNLGESPDEVVRNLLQMNTSFAYQQLSNLQQLMDTHSTYYQAYPVLHYYNNPQKESSLSIRLAVLDEALSIMLSSRNKQSLDREIQPLRNAMTHFFQRIRDKYGEKAGAIPDINWQSLNFPREIQKDGFGDLSSLKDRRKVLTDLLSNEGNSWEDVYPESALAGERK